MMMMECLTFTRRGHDGSRIFHRKCLTINAAGQGLHRVGPSDLLMGLGPVQCPYLPREKVLDKVRPEAGSSDFVDRLTREHSASQMGGV